jgi:hypothetical protein
MNLIEERIRAAARAAAETVAPDSVRLLELPAARPRRLGRRRGPGRPGRPAGPAGVAWIPWAARLAPLAAGMAIIAIVITMVAVSHPARYGPSNGAAAVAAPAVPAGPPVSSYVRSGQVPPYFVTLTPSGAAVRLTVSGVAVATIAPSQPGATVIAVTAAADDRTFVLAEQGRDLRVSFYRYRLGASGRPGAPTRLPMSVAESKMLSDQALSPDGKQLAVALAPGGGVHQVKLYPVQGGPARTWSATGDAIGLLSWTADQRTLAFGWAAGPTDSVRLLDTGSGGGSLLAASHPAVTVAHSANRGQALYQCAGMIITPDGSAVICPSGTITTIARDGAITYSTGFPEFSAATGRVTRTVGHWAQGQRFDPAVVEVLWSDAAGRVLIGVVTSAGRDWVGVISGNTFTPLNAQWNRLSPYGFGAW